MEKKNPHFEKHLTIFRSQIQRQNVRIKDLDSSLTIINRLTSEHLVYQKKMGS